MKAVKRLLGWWTAWGIRSKILIFFPKLLSLNCSFCWSDELTESKIGKKQNEAPNTRYVFSTEVSRFFQKTQSPIQATTRTAKPATSNTGSLQKSLQFTWPTPTPPSKLHTSNFSFHGRAHGQTPSQWLEDNLIFIQSLLCVSQSQKATGWNVDLSLLRVPKIPEENAHVSRA